MTLYHRSQKASTDYIQAAAWPISLDLKNQGMGRSVSESWFVCGKRAGAEQLGQRTWELLPADSARLGSLAESTLLLL